MPDIHSLCCGEDVGVMLFVGMREEREQERDKGSWILGGMGGFVFEWDDGGEGRGKLEV